jgi:hypothetical protein
LVVEAASRRRKERVGEAVSHHARGGSERLPATDAAVTAEENRERSRLLATEKKGLAVRDSRDRRH